MAKPGKMTRGVETVKVAWACRPGTLARKCESLPSWLSSLTVVALPKAPITTMNAGLRHFDCPGSEPRELARDYK